MAGHAHGWFRSVPCLLLAGGTFTLAGCGGDSYSIQPVSGKVTLNGKPHPTAVVVFQPIGVGEAVKTGPGSSSYTDAEGRYKLHLQSDPKQPGAVVGPHQVVVWTKMDSTDDESEWTETIPARYNLHSELKFTVPETGSDQANFDLKSP